MRGKVIDEPHAVQYKDVYWRSQKTHMIIGFSIGNLTTLKKEQLNDDQCLSLANLKEKDRNFIYPQGRRWPNQEDGNLSTEIIDRLESSFKKDGNENDFKCLIRHFNQECFFCGKLALRMIIRLSKEEMVQTILSIITLFNSTKGKEQKN